MEQRMEFDKTINWEQKVKFFKVYKKKDKNGETFLSGEMTKTSMILIQPNKYDKKGEEYIAYFVPVTYKKKEAVKSAPKNVEPEDDGNEPF